MLRWEEKEDIDERFVEVEAAIAQWRERDAVAAEPLRREFNDKLMISWIYHDAALEGEVLSYSEIKAATDAKIISDVSLIPAYEDIKAFDLACRYAIEFAANKKKPITVDLVREIYAILAPEEAAAGCPYRKENPLHRLYYHEISPPDKIVNRMKKFGDWVESDAAQSLHVLERVTKTHQQMMSIFPWAKHSGRVARILSNMMLLREGYPLAVIHAIDRQRYYDALRSEGQKLLSLYLEAVETSAQSAIRVFQEAAARQGRSRRAS